MLFNKFVLSKSRSKKNRSTSRRRLGVERLESRRVLASLISEVHVEPLFGNHDTDQFIELRGAPGATLPSGSYFVTVEGWGAVPGGPGYIHSVIDVSGLSFGGNGFLVIAQSGHPYQIDPTSTSVVSTAAGFSGLPGNRWSDASTLSDRLAFIYGTGTFMLIETATKPVPASDIDANDDGVLDGAAASWNVLDSVGLLRSTAGVARSYGKITFSQEPNYLHPSNTLLIDTDGGGYVGRIGASTGWGANDWVSGTTTDNSQLTGTLYQFTFGTFGDPRPLVYAGRAIDTVGTYNFGGGAQGNVGIDTNNDGVLTAADAPLSNVSVFADSNGNGVRDSVGTQVIAAQYPEGTDLTNRFPNATLTVADSNNKNIGFVVRTRNTFDNAFNTISVLSSEGIPWYDSTDRLKVMFYTEADSVSVQAIAASTLSDSYGRLEIYDRNDQLIGSTQTGPMRGLQRATLSLSRSQADIKYAIIYTNDTIANSSPFGPFDNLAYTYPEFQSRTDAQGAYAIEELPRGGYAIVSDASAVGKIPLSDNSYPLLVSLSEHRLAADFGFRDNLPPTVNNTEISVPENPTLGAIVGQVVASDPDPGQTLSYQFLSPADPFTIDAATGAIKVNNAAPWDFESSLPIKVEVKVSDSFAPSASTTRTITISPTDINEPPKVNNGSFTISENSAVGTLVGVVTASDADAGLAGKLQYAIAAGGPTSVFAIDANNGNITVVSNTSFDFETKPTWTIPFVVRDQGTPSLSTNGQITVQLTNANDAPTAISFSNVITIAENTNTASPIVVANYQLTDDGVGTNNLSIVGPDASFFTIANGQLRFQSATPPDFETKSSYSIQVEVDDPTVGLTPDLVGSFTLTIRDVNEPPTGIQFANVVTSVPESTNTVAGIRVADIVVIDDALGSVTLSLAGADSSLFEIVGRELRLKSITPLDFETQSSLQVTVVADDPAVGKTPDVTSSFGLAISDVNEAPTQVALDVLNSEVSESTQPIVELTIANILVVDDALGTNTFTLAGPDASQFVVVGNQLRIKPGVVFDYETKLVYDVIVRVDDASLIGSVFPETSFRLLVGNRPEVVSLTDALGNPLGSTISTVFVTFDTTVNIAADAMQWRKTDVGAALVPSTFVKTTQNNRTVLEVRFSGPLVESQGLADGIYVLNVDGSKVTGIGTGIGGVNYASSNLNVFATPLPGKVDIVAPTTVLAESASSIQLNLAGITPPPSGNVDYKIDFNGDGVVDRTLSGPLSTSVGNVTYSTGGSYTISVIAEKNGVALGKGSQVIHVSSTTSSDEKWLSALDSDRDNSISPLDVLIIINQINSGSGTGQIPYRLPLDVDRDGSVTPLDVLSVINYLNTDVSSRMEHFSSLVMANTGEAKGVTSDMSISGKIVGTSRNLYVMLDGVQKVDASSFVQTDGSFAIQDAAIAQMFGSLADGNHTLSVVTRSGSEYSTASDKRFVRLTSGLGDFQFKSIVKVGSDTRVQWTSSASGARYGVFVAPTGSTPVQINALTSSNEVRLSGLAPGAYDMFIEAIDGAGNRKRTSLISFEVS